MGINLDASGLYNKEKIWELGLRFFFLRLGVMLVICGNHDGFGVNLNAQGFIKNG